MGRAGGEEEPCVGRDTLLKIQARGRTCPRYEIPPEDEVIADLAMLAARIGMDHPLWDKLFDLHSSALGAPWKLALLYRVIEIVGDPLISAKIKAEREKSAKSNSKG